MHNLLKLEFRLHVECNNDSPAVILEFAAITTAAAARIRGGQVGRKINVGHLASGIKVNVRPFQCNEGFGRPVVVLDRVSVRLNGWLNNVPVHSVGAECVGA